MGFSGAFGFHSYSKNGLIYSGTWNASTNTPFLQSGIGTSGSYYVVDVPGNTNLDGITDWQIGDWAIFNGTSWEKIDNSGITYQGNWNALTNTPTLVSSVGDNGHFYIVDVAGSTNLNGINVWNIGDWAIFTNGVWLKIGSIPGINTLNTLTALVQTFSTGTSGTDFNINSAGSNHEFNLPTASAINRGALSNIDWSTFNNKQNDLGYTPENSANKSTTTADSASSVKFPVWSAVVSYVTGLGYLLASTASSTYQTLANLSTDLTSSSTKYPNVDAVNTGLATKQNTLGYTPEDVANKSSSYTASSTTTYANTKALVDGLATKQNTLTNPVTGTGTNNEIAAFNSTGSTITSLATSTYPSLTELSYVKGVTSAIQTQINNVYVPRIQSVTSAATVTPTNLNDEVVITAQAAALLLANPTGVAVQGQSMLIRIKDNGTARTISYDTQYRAIGVTLPTTTVINKTVYLGLVYNSTDTKWDVIGVAQEA